MENADFAGVDDAGVYTLWPRALLIRISQHADNRTSLNAYVVDSLCEQKWSDSDDEYLENGSRYG